MEKYEIMKCESCRFIGKSVYFRNDWGAPYSIAGDICANLWKAKEWIFKTLDSMAEYIADDMPYAGGIYMWDRYDDRNRQQGYIIGKFMKTDTPVPVDMDYFNIPEGYIAKGWGGFPEGEIKDMLKKSDEYKDASWFWGGEVYMDNETAFGDRSGNENTGYFIWCTPRP